MTMKPENINAERELLEQHALVGAKMLIHPQRYEDIQRWKKDEEKLIYTLQKYMHDYLHQGVR